MTAKWKSFFLWSSNSRGDTIFSNTFSALALLLPYPYLNFTSISRYDLPVPEVGECVKCALNVNGVRKRCVALSLCVALSHSGCVEWLRHALWPCPSILDGSRCQRVHTPNTTQYHTHTGRAGSGAQHGTQKYAWINKMKPPRKRVFLSRRYLENIGK